MNKDLKKRYIMTVVYAVMFVLWTVLVKFVDAQPVGPEGSAVGFATINTAIQSGLPFNFFWYELTQIFGYAALLIAAAFAVTGCIQFITRKSIKKVDRNILTLGCLYILVILLYVFFEKVAVNYRPIIVDLKEGLEASYPSTHTFLILVIVGSALQEIGNYLKNPKLLMALKILGFIVMILTAVGRLLSGVHWFTDIIGGILLSTVLLSLPRAKKQTE